MTKNEAKKLQAGDKVECTHNRRIYTVQSVLLTSDDKRDKVPLIVTTEGLVITHRLVRTDFFDNP
jgi:hypothetical protein